MIHSLHCGQVCVHTTQRETRRTLRYAKGSPFGRAGERSETERVRMLTVSHSHSDKVSLCKEHSCKDKHNLLPHTIAYRNAISNIKIRCARRHTPPGTP